MYLLNAILYVLWIAVLDEYLPRIMHDIDARLQWRDYLDYLNSFNTYVKVRKRRCVVRDKRGERGKRNKLIEDFRLNKWIRELASSEPKVQKNKLPERKIDNTDVAEDCSEDSEDNEDSTDGEDLNEDFDIDDNPKSRPPIIPVPRPGILRRRITRYVTRSVRPATVAAVAPAPMVSTPTNTCTKLDSPAHRSLERLPAFQSWLNYAIDDTMRTKVEQMLLDLCRGVKVDRRTISASHGVLHELRIHFPMEGRVYFVEDNTSVRALAGGFKQRQTKDIRILIESLDYL
jgi:putative component of toxin-antitoxin plasmid stabilization module